MKVIGIISPGNYKEEVGYNYFIVSRGIILESIFLLNDSHMEKKTQSEKGRALDRAKVAGGQAHEVNYEREKLEVSSEEMKKLIKAYGNSRNKLEAKRRHKPLL